MIASMVAADCKDITFLVLMGGIATTGIENAISQVAMQLEADGATKEMIAADSKIRRQLLSIVMQENDLKKANSKMNKVAAYYFDSLSKDLKEEAMNFAFTIKQLKTDEMILFLNSPSYRYWLKHNPATVMAQITTPVLVLNGDHDFIATSTVQMPVFSNALQDNNKALLIEVPKANHWLQTCKNGSLAEYGTIKETMSPDALEQISSWINKITS